MGRTVGGWLLAALLCSGCSGHESDPARPNLVLVSLDTVRADRTSLLGYPRPTTPNLERLAAGGRSFERAYAMTSTTGPSHATLFTGQYAPTHGVARNGMPLPEAAETLAERLSARGYRSAGFLGSFVLSGRFGFDQGFGDWDEDFAFETSSLPMPHWEGHAVPEKAFDRSAAETTRRALDWIRNHGQRQPFFAFVHYFDAHEPYTPSPEDLARIPVPAGPIDPVDPEVGDLRAYDAEIAGVDHQLGVLLSGLDELGLASNTLVVVTSDHGQGLTDHDDAFHSVNLYEESVRAVLVFRGPGVTSASVPSPAPVEAVDVLPTILDLLDPGDPTGSTLPGRSLASHLGGAADVAPDRPIHVYRQFYPRKVRVRRAWVQGAQFGIRVGPWKYIEGERGAGAELYHLAQDPAERSNRIAEEPERASELRARLAAWRIENPTPGSRAPELSEEDRARLQALGYVE